MLSYAQVQSDCSASAQVVGTLQQAGHALCTIAKALNLEECHRHAIAINEGKIDAREEKDTCIKYVGASQVGCTLSRPVSADMGTNTTVVCSP